jgi:hypothetical protein
MLMAFTHEQALQIHRAIKPPLVPCWTCTGSMQSRWKRQWSRTRVARGPLEHAPQNENLFS